MDTQIGKEEGAAPVEATSAGAARLEYPVRALVRAGVDIGPRWPAPGSVIMAKKDDYGSGYTSEDPGHLPFEWFGDDLIINPTPAQIAEERAKAGLKATPSPSPEPAEAQWAIEHDKAMLPHLFATSDLAYAWLEENKKGAGTYWVREVRAW